MSRLGDNVEVVVRTPGFNPKFPNYNQTKACWSAFVNWKQCTILKGSKDEECLLFKADSYSLCNREYTDMWEEQIEEGKFGFPLSSPQDDAASDRDVVGAFDNLLAATGSQ